MNRKRMINLLVAAVVVVLLTPLAKADSLDITLTDTNQTVVAGTTVVEFFGTITNPTADTIYLLSDTISSSGDSVLDDSPFDNNAPLSLGAGDSSGLIELFDLDIPGTAPASYTGYFEIDGLSDADIAAGNYLTYDLANVTVTVNVVSPVTATPEPTTFLLLGCGMALLCLLKWRVLTSNS